MEVTLGNSEKTVSGKKENWFKRHIVAVLIVVSLLSSMFGCIGGFFFSMGMQTARASSVPVVVPEKAVVEVNPTAIVIPTNTVVPTPIVDPKAWVEDMKDASSGYYDAMDGLQRQTTKAGEDYSVTLDKSWCNTTYFYLDEMVSYAATMARLDTGNAELNDIFETVLDETRDLRYNMKNGVQNNDVDSLNAASDNVNNIGKLFSRASDIMDKMK